MQDNRVTAQIDPVCGMTVDPQRAAGELDYNGKHYLFCCQGCLRKFQANPESFLKTAESPNRPSGFVEIKSAPQSAAEYTCPMHPEIARDRPGSCPKCGMA